MNRKRLTLPSSHSPCAREHCQICKDPYVGSNTIFNEVFGLEEKLIQKN